MMLDALQNGQNLLLSFAFGSDRIVETHALLCCFLTSWFILQGRPGAKQFLPLHRSNHAFMVPEDVTSLLSVMTPERRK